MRLLLVNVPINREGRPSIDFATDVPRLLRDALSKRDGKGGFLFITKKKPFYETNKLCRPVTQTPFLFTEGRLGFEADRRSRVAWGGDGGARGVWGRW